MELHNTVNTVSGSLRSEPLVVRGRSRAQRAASGSSGWALGSASGCRQAVRVKMSSGRLQPHLTRPQRTSPFDFDVFSPLSARWRALTPLEGAAAEWAA